MMVSSPEVVTKKEDGELKEPYERLEIEAAPQVYILKLVLKFDH